MQFVDYTLIRPTAITSCFGGNIICPDSIDFIIVRAERKIEIININQSEGDVEDELLLGYEFSLDSYNTVNSVICVRNLDQMKGDYMVIGLSDSIIVISVCDSKISVIQNFPLNEKTERSVFSRYLATDIQTGSFVTAPLEGGIDFYKQFDGKFSCKRIDTIDQICFGIAAIGNDCYVMLIKSLSKQSKQIVLYDFINDTSKTMNVADDVVNIFTLNTLEYPTNKFVVTSRNIVYIYDNDNVQKYILPRRADMKDDSIVPIINVIAISIDGNLVCLIQNELGDIFRIFVNSTIIEYFDTIPPTVAWGISKNFLLCASESDSHSVIKLVGLTSQLSIDTTKTYTPFNNFLIESTPMISHHPLTGISIPDNSNIFELQAYVGKGSRSTIQTMVHGLNATEYTSSPLQKPTNIWTLKPWNQDIHQYVIIGFENQTQVLKVIEDGLDGCPECCFGSNLLTLHAGMLVDGTLVQIHSDGIITIDNGNMSEHKSGEGTIILGTSNSYQILIALQSVQKEYEIVYFDYNPETKKLLEVDRRIFKSEISSIALGDCEEGRAKKIAIACVNGEISLLNLEKGPKCCMPILPEPIHVSDIPNSLSLVRFDYVYEPAVYLCVGGKSGIFLSYKLINDSAEQIQYKYVGNEPVTLSECTLCDSKCVMIGTDKMWLMYAYMNRIEFSPISYPSIKAFAAFTTDFSGHSIAGITNDNLVVIGIDSLEDRFTITSHPLKYTPKKIINTNSFPLTLVCSDNRTKQYTPTITDSGDILERIVNKSPEESGTWIGEINIIKNGEIETKVTVDKAIICGAHVVLKQKRCFISSEVEHMKDGKENNWLVVYNTNTFNVIHKTPIEGVCRAIAGCNKRVLVGIGTTLRLYDLGKQILIRKCELNGLPSTINQIIVNDNYIVVSCISSGFVYVEYDVCSNVFNVVEKDKIWHNITAAALLDKSTIIGGDKLGGLFISESSRKQKEIFYKNKESFANEVVQWYVGDVITSLIVSEVWRGEKNDVEKGSLEELKDNKNVIVYSTLMGRIGVLIPLNWREDEEFFVKLESEIKQNYHPLLRTNFDAYRSSLYPSIGIVDGDLCEFYAQMDDQQQLEIAQNMNSTPTEIKLKCEEFKHSKIF
ncbi:Splicing factor 3b subunit 3 [Entamoeba marina]